MSEAKTLPISNAGLVAMSEAKTSQVSEAKSLP